MKNAYGVETPGSVVGWAMGVAVPGGIALGLVQPGPPSGPGPWMVAAVLLLVTVPFVVKILRLTAGPRRETRRLRERAGYRRGEQPWSWAEHVGILVVAVVLALVVVGDGLRDRDAWALLVVSVVAMPLTLGGLAWSALQKWRRERAHETADPSIWRTRTSTAALAAGGGLLLLAAVDLLPGDELRPVAITAVAAATGAAYVVLGLVLRRREIGGDSAGT